MGKKGWNYRCEALNAHTLSFISIDIYPKPHLNVNLIDWINRICNCNEICGEQTTKSLPELEFNGKNKEVI
jgi:hypothetical protein